MKKLTLKPEDLCVESFGTLALPRARGTVQGAIMIPNTFLESCTCDSVVNVCDDTNGVCQDSIDVCPDTYFCGDTKNASCPHTCGIAWANGAGGDAMQPQSWNCPCM
jgi:hypothetical protein